MAPSGCILVNIENNVYFKENLVSECLAFNEIATLFSDICLYKVVERSKTKAKPKVSMLRNVSYWSGKMAQEVRVHRSRDNTSSSRGREIRCTSTEPSQPVTEHGTV